MNWETDRFSTYLIAYKDADASAASETSETGDESLLYVWILLLTSSVSALMIMHIMARRSKKAR